MAIEIEKKYLLLPIRVEHFLRMLDMRFEKVDVTQNYITRDGKTGRVRKYNDKYYLTIKKGEGLVREEYEKEITADIYNNILSSSDNTNTIHKMRYIVELNGFVYEIDEFLDNLEGLVFLEVEFKSREESLRFNMDARFKKIVVKEVTQDKKFYNLSIAAAQTIPWM